MLEQVSPLWEVFLKHKQSNEPLVLATLIKTAGSSYKKPGAMMLIEADRTTHGLISGGCLEGDVAEHALTVFESQLAITLTYDLSDESIFGLGAGCDGTIHIVLQLLKGDYLPFSALNPLPEQASKLSLFINHNDTGDYQVGDYFIKTNDTVIESNLGVYNQFIQSSTVLKYQPPPSIAICGAGIDLIPLLQTIQMLQWHVCVIDHRNNPQVLENHAPNTKLISANPTTLDKTIGTNQFDAVVIMTHNLNRDAQYLNYFIKSNIQWIGLLGPPKRRDRVIELSGLKVNDIGNRLHAPVGLNLGGRMPENIAISIVAQLQAHFYSKVTIL